MSDDLAEQTARLLRELDELKTRLQTEAWRLGALFDQRRELAAIEPALTQLEAAVEEMEVIGQLAAQGHQTLSASLADIRRAARATPRPDAVAVIAQHVKKGGVS